VRTLSTMNQYYSLALLEMKNEKEIAIEVISITPESCDLSGAWVLNFDEIKKIRTIITGRALMISGSRNKIDKEITDLLTFEVKLQDFLKEARCAVSKAELSFENFREKNEAEYSQYMKVDPTSRKLLPKVVKKNLTKPEFHVWPVNFKISDSENFLTTFGRAGLIPSENNNLGNVLINARVIQLFIDWWREDEIERLNKIYILGESSHFSILPNCWIKS
jgi:hypothetical protein